MKHKTGKLSIICMAVLLILAMISGCTEPPAPKTKEVDALTFLLAFQEGKADQYKDFIVKGEGREFANYLMGMAPKGPLDLWLGTIGDDKKVQPLQSWEEWSDAESAGQPMLMLEISGDFTRKDFNPSDMPSYTFSGRFTGETVSKRRLVYRTDTAPPPYSAPVLTEGSVE
jgi:hypothetical protein